MVVRDFEDAGDHAALLLHEKGGRAWDAFKLRCEQTEIERVQL